MRVHRFWHVRPSASAGRARRRHGLRQPRQEALEDSGGVLQREQGGLVAGPAEDRGALELVHLQRRGARVQHDAPGGPGLAVLLAVAGGTQDQGGQVAGPVDGEAEPGAAGGEVQHPARSVLSGSPSRSHRDTGTAWLEGSTPKPRALRARVQLAKVKEDMAEVLFCEGCRASGVYGAHQRGWCQRQRQHRFSTVTMVATTSASRTCSRNPDRFSPRSPVHASPGEQLLVHGLRLALAARGRGVGEDLVGHVQHPEGRLRAPACGPARRGCRSWC